MLVKKVTRCNISRLCAFINYRQISWWIFHVTQWYGKNLQSTHSYTDCKSPQFVFCCQIDSWNCCYFCARDIHIWHFTGYILRLSNAQKVRCQIPPAICTFNVLQFQLCFILIWYLSIDSSYLALAHQLEEWLSPRKTASGVGHE